MSPPPPPPAMAPPALSAAPRSASPAPAPAAPAAPSQVKSRGFLGTLRNFFVGGVDEEAGSPATVRARDEGAPVAQEPVARILRGRVVLQAKRALVIEILVEGAPLTWSPAAEATLTLADGRTLTVTVMVARSTRAGTAVAPGASARLTLALPDDAPLDVRSITLALDGDTVLIELG